METEYLGFLVSNQGVRPLLSNIDSVNKIDVPTKVCDVHRLLGLVNLYRDMWHNRVRTLVTLTKLCFTKFKFEWTYVEQKYFMEMKKIVRRDMLFSYPNFSKEFMIHTDARKT